MPIVSYEKVENHHKKIYEPTKSHLKKLEDALVTLREEQNVPIYSMKWRVKSVDSVYLKTKRKAKSLEQISDYGGLRILCMFEQDILSVHEALVQTLRQQKYRTEEFRVYNWENNDDFEMFKAAIINRFPNAHAALVDTASDYKSIHYTVSRKERGIKVRLEIQLRTLIQDVWGELSHTLLYKQGRNNLQIRKSFELLARDLATTDKLLVHLREISDRERYISFFALEKNGPYRLFWYERNLVPKVFKNKDAIGKTFDRYDDHITTNRPADLVKKNKWIEKARVLFRRIETNLSKAQKNEPGVKALLILENAYLHFLEGNIDEALTLYESLAVNLIPSMGQRQLSNCVRNFRIGEIYLIQGRLEEALKHFDKSEARLPAAKNTDWRALRNAYHLKVRLAYVYWLAGEEYYEIAYAKILDAERILKFCAPLMDFSRVPLLNNLSYYATERFRVIDESEEKRKQTAYADAQRAYSELLPTLKTGEAASNGFDSAAWFCFQSYKYHGSKDSLNKAKKFIRMMWYKKGAAVDPVIGLTLERSHTEEILTAT